MEASLRHAQEMEAIGFLTEGIARDSQALLKEILGRGEALLVETGKGHGGTERVLEIVNAARRARDLNRQLLEFSRKLESRLVRVDLHQEVRQTVRALQRLIPGTIEIELRLRDDVRLVLADSVQVEQVLTNLTRNACEAMPEGGKLIIETENKTLDEIFCRSHEECTPGEYVLLRITDTGRGMEEPVLQNLFEPFFTTKKAGKGTGLGLTIVRGILKNHRGCIRCESSPGRGSVFELYWPAAGKAPRGTRRADPRGSPARLGMHPPRG